MYFNLDLFDFILKWTFYCVPVLYTLTSLGTQSCILKFARAWLCWNANVGGAYSILRQIATGLALLDLVIIMDDVSKIASSNVHVGYILFGKCII